MGSYGCDVGRCIVHSIGADQETVYTHVPPVHIT